MNFDPKSFEKYESLLRDWNSRMNLVAPSTLSDIRDRHIDDSLQLADFIPKNSNIIDLGSGAGFPGVVLAVLGHNVTCIESIGKKAGFLNELKKELVLPNLDIYNGRVEDFVRKFRQGAALPIYTARAFASLIKIFDLTYAAKGRYFLLKGRNIDAEIAEAGTRYKFEYKLTPSKTGDGFIVEINNLKRK